MASASNRQRNDLAMAVPPAAPAATRAKQVATIVPFVLMLFLALSALAHAQGGAPLKVDRSVAPDSGLLGQVEFAVTLRLSGDSSVCPAVVSATPSDIILVVDHSSSMAGANLEAMKSAAKAFIAQANLRQDRIAIVTFDDAAVIAQSLTDKPNVLTQAIDEITASGGTAIDQGVEFGMRELAGESARPDVAQVIVLMTDGQQGVDILSLFTGANSPLQKAAQAKTRGIRVITIGLGNDAAHDLLKQMASQAGDYYFAPSSGDLTSIYKTIGQSIVKPVAATNVILEHSFDATSFDVVDGSISANGTQNGNKIVWEVKQVLDATTALSYRLRPRVAGAANISNGDTIRFNACGSQPDQLALPAGLSVNVIGPTATPSPTPEATATPLPTPMPTPTPTPVPPVGEQIAQSIAGFACDLSWLSVCLGILLLLFAVWWLMRLLRALHERQCICNLLPWLFIPLLLILLGFVLNALSPALCKFDAVYFWRIESSGSIGRVYVTDQHGLRPAREFASVSPGRCVGCHTVSSQARVLGAIAGSGEGDVVLYGLDGHKIDTPGIMGAFVAVSPDGRKAAIASTDMDIQVLDIATQQMTKLAGASDPTIRESMPAWSADGKSIAFVRGTSADHAYSFSAPTDIYRVPATGGAAQPIRGASGDGFNYYPAFSPDGRWLAFTRHVSGTTTYAAPEAEIFVVPASGGERIRLRANDVAGAPLTNASNSWPMWSLDSTKIAFTSKRNDPAYDIFIADIDAAGNSGPAQPLERAAMPNVFEHTPFWGQSPEFDLPAALLSLLPCLIPFVLLLLAWLLCRRFCRERVAAPMPESPRPAPGPLPRIEMEPTWQVAPTLMVGVGGTGRWVLTHLKKALQDGSGGSVPKDVRFVMVDTSEREETNIFIAAGGQREEVSFGGVALDRSEMVLVNDNLNAIISRDQLAAERDAALLGWFPYNEYQRIPEGQRNLAEGTFGRRPMARAGLIEKLRRPPAGNEAGEASGTTNADLWRALREGSEAARDPNANMVRIVVVGSLAGGMGGMLCDVAYLARCAARAVLGNAGTVTVEGYLTTPGAFTSANLGQNQTRLEVNAAAGMRELERFQLSEGFPFPMTYAGSPADGSAQGDGAPLAGACDWMLFDHATLFGGEVNPDRAPGKSTQPWATTYASMADVIALRMDRATNAGGAGDNHAGLRNDISTRQNNAGEVVVSAAGSFAYKLPLADIIALAQAQWGHKLFNTFINGNAALTAESFDANKANMKEAADAYAQRFVAALHEAGPAPAGMRAVADLAAGVANVADVTALAGNEDDEAFRAYLSAGIGLILNGSAQESGLSSQAPRLGYAMSFLEAVRERLQAALASAEAQQTGGAEEVGARSFIHDILLRLGIGKLSRQEWSQVADCLKRWSIIVTQARESLGSMRSALLSDAKATRARSAEAERPGVLDELRKRQAFAEARRKQMDQVAVRRYIWCRPKDDDSDPTDEQGQIDIAEDLFRRADAKLSSYLGRFYWRMQPDGRMQLSLTTDSDKPIVLRDNDPASIQQMANEIERLALHVTREMLQDMSLADVLATQLPKQAAPAQVFVEQSWRWAQPHLAPARNVNADLDGRRLAAVGMPERAARHTELAEVAQTYRTIGAIDNKINRQYEPAPVAFVAATDANSLTVVREYTLMPMRHLPEMQKAWLAYVRNAGSDTDRDNAGALVATAFAAERAALEFERRLEAGAVVNQDFHALHPLLVLAMAQPDRAELYACAFAAGWVTLRDRAAVLTLPDGAETRLNLRERASSTASLDWRIAGLLQFVMLAGTDDPAHVLREAFSSASRPTRDAWRAFIDRAKAHGADEENAAVRDLMAVSALAAYRRLLVPAARDARWDELVMRRSRLV